MSGRQKANEGVVSDLERWLLQPKTPAEGMGAGPPTESLEGVEFGAGRCVIQVRGKKQD